ncbi:MAG: MmcQ/YjbR family DNA-binding protein [Phycisphaerae bacterium]
MSAQRRESGTPQPAPRDVQRRARVCAAVESLPEAECVPYGERHIAFRVRGKAFAYYLFHHHDDGRVALCAKAPRGRQQQLVSAAPARYFVPAYLGRAGWVSLRLDQPRVAWEDVLALIVDAYRLQAPKRLAAELE